MLLFIKQYVLKFFILKKINLIIIVILNHVILDGGLMALQKGWAFNLSGGYHHAHTQNGGGFCVYPDITLTINHLRKFKSREVKKVMIIDLDAH